MTLGTRGGAMAGEAKPLVSVIICTRDRPEGLARALASVRNQIGADCATEVIVVDDGDLGAILPEAPGDLRLIRTARRGPGGARDTGLDAARGELVAYCDDDDEWTPDHLCALLDAMRADPTVALVYGDANDATPSPGVGSSGIDLLAEPGQFSASGVLHRADAARDVGGFDPSLRAYEDAELWLRIGQNYSVRHLPRAVFVRGTPINRVSAEAHDPHVDLLREKVEVMRAILTLNADVAKRGPDTPPPFDPRTWEDGRRELIWQTHLHPTNSYGVVGRNLLLAAERQGIAATVPPLIDKRSPEGLERFHGPLPGWDRLGFLYDSRLLSSTFPVERLIFYGMWETTLVPRIFVEGINRDVTLLYVPCRQNVEVFQERGVRVPIKVLHHGVDPASFPPLERPQRDVFTFGTFGGLTARKGVDVLIRAFRAEFGPAEPVRLVLKDSGPFLTHLPDDPRIETVSGFVDQAGLLEFLRRLDAFVLPSRGEGFGLCGLEAMATGLPLIATNWSGPAEYLDPADSFPLAYELVEAEGFQPDGSRSFGLWAEPDHDHLRHLLRWLFEHPEEAAARGRQAAARTRREWSWDRAAYQIRQDFDAIAAGATPAGSWTV